MGRLWYPWFNPVALFSSLNVVEIGGDAVGNAFGDFFAVAGSDHERLFLRVGDEGHFDECRRAGGFF